MPEMLILNNSYYCLFDSSDEDYHMNWINCATVRGFVIPPVLCMWGTLLEPHEGVASGAQRQATDPISPLLLGTVAITKAGQHNDRLAGFLLENDG